MSLKLATVVVRASDHIETRVGDETMMMSPAMGKYYALKATGQRIWELAEGPIAVSAIVDQLRAEYDVDKAQCETDVLGFVGSLLENKLLRIHDDGPGHG
ncbi:MAG: PqqD family peptide modification chaperone [Pseudomonadota bacterium]